MRNHKLVTTLAVAMASLAILASPPAASAGLIFKIYVNDQLDGSGNWVQSLDTGVGGLELVENVSVLKFKVTVTVTGASGQTTSDDVFQSAYTSYMGTETTGALSAIRGLMSNAAAGADFTTFNAGLYNQDLNSDTWAGDMGSTAGSSTNPSGLYFYTRAATYLPGTERTLLTFDYTVKNLADSGTGTTVISGLNSPNSGGLLWKYDNAIKTGATSTGLVTWNGATLNYSAGGTTPQALIGLSNATEETIIVGGSGVMNVTIANTGDAGSTLNYSVDGAGVNITVTGGPDTGSLGAGGNAVASVNVTSTTVGALTLTWTGTGNASNSPQTTNATLNVLDHAAPGLTTGSVDIGKVLQGATVSVNTSLTNAAGLRAKLEIVNLGGLGGASVGDKVNAGGQVALSGTVNTSVLTDNPADFVVQVKDDSALDGKGATGLANQVLTVTGVVGKAIANDTPSGMMDFDAAEMLIATNVSDVSNLMSQVVNVGGDILGSQAMLRWGTLAGSPTVTMNWRCRLPDEVSIYGSHLAADVLQLGGIADGQVYVLEMSYSDQVDAIKGIEGDLAGLGQIYLASWNGSEWVNAIELNDGGTKDLTSPVLGGWTGQTALGTWGVDVDNNKVWAVLNHASEFSVVPEPATMAFLMLGGLAMAGAGLRRRRRS